MIATRAMRARMAPAARRGQPPPAPLWEARQVSTPRALADVRFHRPRPRAFLPFATMPRRPLLRALGDPAVDLAVYLVDVAAVSGETILAVGRSAGRLRPVVREVLWRQVYFTAVRAAPFTLLLALLVALAVAAQSPFTAGAGGEVLGTVLVATRSSGWASIRSSTSSSPASSEPRSPSRA
jgi:hypothetical protein